MRDACLHTLKGERKRHSSQHKDRDDDGRIHGFGVGGMWTDEEVTSEEDQAPPTPASSAAESSRRKRVDMKTVVEQRLRQKGKELELRERELKLAEEKQKIELQERKAILEWIKKQSSS